MKTKLKTILIISCILFLCVFTACRDPFDDEYDNPNAGLTRDFKFSHESGLYASGFNLEISSVPGTTIYYTTDGSIPAKNKPGTKTYSSAISIVNRNSPMQENVLATPANHAQMYMYPNDPRGDVPQVYTGLTKEKVPKATVIRAISINEDGQYSDIITKTFFVGNNAQLFGNTNARILSLIAEPDDLVSKEKGILVRGGDDKRWDGPIEKQYNFRQRGEEWERVAALELFDSSSSKNLLLATKAGIRIRGGYSRGIGQKSFNVYFREEHGGINNFRSSDYSFELIPGAVKANGTPVERTKSFMLRSGGNDSDQTKFKDVFVHDMLKDRNFTTQTTQAVIVYLNGEYWGPYNMSERYSDNFYEYKYGVNRNNVISIDNGSLDDGNPGEENSFWNGLNDMINTGNYNQFCQRFDIDNFIDYFAAQMYIFNQDWPQNNYVVWRTRNVEQGNPYGDTKWRYSLHDTEFSMGLYNNGKIINENLNCGPGTFFDGVLKNDHAHGKVFKELIKNTEFRTKFVNVMLELYNVNFHPDNFNTKLDYYINLYKPLMGPDYVQVPGYYTRWSGWSFDSQAEDARRYLTDIRAAIPGYLQTYLQVPSGALKNITLSTSLSGTSITINGYTPDISGGWAGLFNTSGGVTITASAAPSGYTFDGWTVTGGTAVNASAQSTIVTVSSTSAAILAKYIKTGDEEIPVSGITLNQSTLDLPLSNTFILIANVTPANATYKNVSWSSGNNSIATVDQTGKVTAVSEGNTTITAVSAVDNTKSAACTVTVTPFKFQGETVVGSYAAHESNPYIDLSSSAPYEIVTISEKTGYVMKIYNPNCWQLDQWEVAYKYIGSQYKGQSININFSAEVYRVGEAGNLNWQMNNNNEWPTIGAVWSAGTRTWHAVSSGMNGNSNVTPTNDNPMFYLSAWDEDEENPPGRNAKTVFYIANYSMSVTQ